jgi:hypothetical protein
MRSGKRNKAAGHTWELTCVKKLKDIGFERVGTARLISRLRDSQKVDICNFDEDEQGRFPYNIQCKNLSRACNYPQLLSELPEGKEINVIFHKQTKLVGTRFMPMGEYAILALSDFITMMKERNNYKIAFDLLNVYFDCFPDDEKEEVNSKLQNLGL